MGFSRSKTNPVTQGPSLFHKAHAYSQSMLLNMQKCKSAKKISFVDQRHQHTQEDFDSPEFPINTEP